MWKRADRVVVCVQSPLELCLVYTVTVEICYTMWDFLQILNIQRKLILLWICIYAPICNDLCWEICLNNIIFYNTTKQHRMFVWLPWLFCSLRTVAWMTSVCFYTFWNIFWTKTKTIPFLSIKYPLKHTNSYFYIAFFHSKRLNSLLYHHRQFDSYPSMLARHARQPDLRIHTRTQTPFNVPASRRIVIFRCEITTLPAVQ